MPDKLPLAALLRDEQGWLTVKHLGLAERGMGGRFVLATPADTLTVVEPASARKLAADLLAWAEMADRDAALAKEIREHDAECAGCMLCDPAHD